ncbi:MAG TPA: hypothetical protein VF867_19620 [Arthrobacter sp.]
MNRNVPSPGGSPGAHNRHRGSEKALDGTMKGFMRLDSPGGRRRKKHIMKIEGGRLRELVVAVAQDLYEKRHTA